MLAEVGDAKHTSFAKTLKLRPPKKKRAIWIFNGNWNAHRDATTDDSAAEVGQGVADRHGDLLARTQAWQTCNVIGVAQRWPVRVGGPVKSDRPAAAIDGKEDAEDAAAANPPKDKTFCRLPQHVEVIAVYDVHGKRCEAHFSELG